MSPERSWNNLPISSGCSDHGTMNTVCGTIRDIFDSDIRVTVDRKNACEGCQSMNICHGFTKRSMDIRLPKPPAMPVNIGDTVIIALEGPSLIKASAYAFLIPLAAIISALFAAEMMSAGVGVQVFWALLAFSASLIIVRHMGKKVGTPRIIEVIHEE